jgi:hypothetical protein
MAVRFDRQNATALGVWKAINRLAAAYRDEDVRERAGRRSWTPPAAVFARLPWLRNTVIVPARAALKSQPKPKSEPKRKAA